MSTDEQPTRARAKRLSLPVAERLLKRFSDAALAAQMSTQRATNEALKAWMASPASGRAEGRGAEGVTARISRERETKETETASTQSRARERS